MYSAAFAHTVALSSVQPVRRQAKPAHTDFDLCHHTATRSPSVLFKWSSRIKYIIQKVKTNISKNYTKIGHRAWRNYLTCWLWPLKLHILPTNYDIELLAKNWSVCLQHKYDTHTHTHYDGRQPAIDLRHRHTARVITFALHGILSLVVS